MRRRIFTHCVSILLVGGLVAIAADAKPQKVILAVSGMYCESCATGITEMLKRTEGVLEGRVSYEAREAVVHNDASKTSPKKIVAVIEKLGYKAAIKK